MVIAVTNSIKQKIKHEDSSSTIVKINLMRMGFFVVVMFLNSMNLNKSTNQNQIVHDITIFAPTPTAAAVVKKNTLKVDSDNVSVSAYIVAATYSSTATEANVTTADDSSSLPINLHSNFLLDLASIASLNKDRVSKQVDPSIFGQFEMVHGYSKGQRNGVGHRMYAGPMINGVDILTKLQSYNYAALDRFWELLQDNKNMRFSAHGGTLMGSACHGSINPWDDDIDITVNNCTVLEEVFNKSPLATDTFPDMSQNQHTAAGWIGRAIDKEWILIKGPRSHPWYKLKSITQINDIPNPDLSGMDIMCFGNGISRPERTPMKKSGYQEYMMGNKPMPVVPFGPTMIMQVPDAILRKYVLLCYEKDAFCDFPLGKKHSLSFPQTLLPPSLHVRAFQTHQAISKYYISPSVRGAWLDQVGLNGGKGNKLTQDIPNLDHVEIDNSIAPREACKIGNSTTIKVVDWNAERGTYWAEFAEMIEAIPDLEKPTVLVLNEMDIGMARSGNVHTARKLAFRLGMNYAWGLEFVELTNGNAKEQNDTLGMKNAMGLHGNAILSSCPIFDPILVRDRLDEQFFSNKRFKKNAMGHEKRLGGRMGMFVRTGALLDHAAADDNSGLMQYSSSSTSLLQQRHIIVGSVHKVKPETQREKLWSYFGFGSFPNITKDELPKSGVAAHSSNVLGIVMAGDLESRNFCTHAGIKNLDKPMKHRTFPVDCPTKQIGHWREDQFCGNMEVDTDDKNFLPCYLTGTTTGDGSTNSTVLQLSDHAIIQIILKTKGRRY